MKLLFQKMSYDLSKTERMLVSLVYQQPTNAYMFVRVSELDVQFYGTFVLVEWSFSEDEEEIYSFRYGLISCGRLNVQLYHLNEVPRGLPWYKEEEA